MGAFLTRASKLKDGDPEYLSAQQRRERHAAKMREDNAWLIRRRQAAKAYWARVRALDLETCNGAVPELLQGEGTAPRLEVVPCGHQSIDS